MRGIVYIDSDVVSPDNVGALCSFLVSLFVGSVALFWCFLLAQVRIGYSDREAILVCCISFVLATDRQKWCALLREPVWEEKRLLSTARILFSWALQ